MRRLLVLVLLLYAACLGATATKPSCDPREYAAAVAAAYAPHVEECADFDGGVDNCPGYQQARADVAKLHKEYVDCR